MKKLYLPGLIIFLLIAFSLYGDDEINENALFQNTQTVVPVTEVTGKTTTFSNETTEPVTTNFTGDIYLKLSYLASQRWLERGNTKQNRLMENIESNFYLDIKLRKNFKSFISFSGIYYPQGVTEIEEFTELNKTSLSTTPQTKTFLKTSYLKLFFRELFVDYNIKRKFFIRIGKQVANIGTCFFWNPTDLIDIEQKNFYDISHPREGINAIKMTWNLFNWYNLYGFITMGGETDPQNFGYLLRNEFLTGNTEWGLIVWSKRKLPVVFGGDISTRILGIDIYGEATASKGDYMQHLKFTSLGFNITLPNGIEGEAFKPVITREREKWIYRASVDFSRSFDLELPDRIITTLEFFYNGGGYSKNIFFNPLLARYFIYSGLYKPNYYGKLYTAFFGTINPLIGDNTILSLNTLSNLTDKTSVVNLIFTYKPVYNMNLNFYLTAFTGPSDGEYTWQGIRGALTFYTQITW